MSSDALAPRSAPRGDATRDRLVTSAMRLFARQGYDGVGAREIAAAAGAQLGAIPYHFGTKEALYRAVLERVRARMGAALAPAAAAAQASLHGPPEAARDALVAFQGAMLDVIAASPEAEDWARLLLREHMDPGPAFDLVYEDAARGAVELMAALLARATGRAPDDEAVLIEAFALVGEVLVFRTVRHAVVRRLGWNGLGPEEAARIRGVLARRRR